MSKSKNNSIQALWVAMGSLSSLSISIISVAVLSRYLSKEEYGTYRQIIYIYNTLLVVFSAGLPRVFAYYLPRYDLAKGKDIVFKISKILFFTGLGFSLFLFLGSGFISEVMNNPDLEIGIKYFSPVPMFLLPTLGIEGIFSSYKKTEYIAIYNTLTRFLMLLFIVLPVIIFKVDYLYTIYGWVIASMITFLIAIYFKNIPFSKTEKEKSFLSINEILKYSLPLLIASIGSIAIKSADQFYIGRYFGAEVFAEYANGFIELPFVGMITFSIASVLMPIFSKLNHDKSDSHEIVDVWQRALMKSAMIIYPLVMFFWVYAKDIMVILFSSTYSSSALYFRIALIANFFNVIMFAPLLLSMGKTKFYSNILVVFAIIAWIGGYVTVILTDSPIALAIFSVSRAVLLTLIAFYYTSKLIKVKFLVLFPVDKLSILVIHSIMSLFIVKYTLNSFIINTNNIFVLGFLFCCFVLILLLTSKLFKLNYLSFLEPIIISFKSFLKRKR